MAKLKNAKREEFCQQYIIDKNATQAAIRAKYSERTAKSQGQRLLTFADVKQRIEELQNEQFKRIQVDADYVITTIVDTIERCRQSVTPVTYKNGEPVLTTTEDGDLAQAYQYDSSAVLRGAELLGKHLKMFTDKMEHGADAELSAMLREFFNMKPTTGLPSER